MIRVAVAGAAGRMGREVVRAVSGEADMRLVAAFDVVSAGVDAGAHAGMRDLGVAIAHPTEEALTAAVPDVLVDFTAAQSSLRIGLLAISLGVRLVSGTTGLGDAGLAELQRASADSRVGMIYAPNFSIGAVLMMHFAALAARYMHHAEIIELHHDGKRDAPSGTALLTAKRIRATWDHERVQTVSANTVPARGDLSEGVAVHSVRLPGLVAHQEVLFGSTGQILSIRHDSLDRASFMPGVLLAIRRVLTLDGPVIGLDSVLGL